MYEKSPICVLNKVVLLPMELYLPNIDLEIITLLPIFRVGYLNKYLTTLIFDNKGDINGRMMCLIILSNINR